MRALEAFENDPLWTKALTVLALIALAVPFVASIALSISGIVLSIR
jgi:hypothetical protein